MLNIVKEIRPRRIVQAPREIKVISPTGVVSLLVGIILRPWVGRIHMFQ